MLSSRSRGASRLKKTGPRADDANGDVRGSIDNASTIGSVGTRAKRSMGLKGRFGFGASSKIKGSESESGSASDMGSVNRGKSGSDNGDSASRELGVKRSEDCQGNNDTTIKSAGVYGNTTLERSEEVGVNKTTTVKHPEDGDDIEDGNDKGECDRADKGQGSGSDSGRVLADPDGTGREASAGDMTAAVGPIASQLTGIVIDFNTPPHPPQIANFPCGRFPSRPSRLPGSGQPVGAQLRRLPPRAPTPTAGPAFRASTTSDTYPPSNLPVRPYSAASTASSSATMTPAVYSRRNFPVENRQMQYPPRRFHHPRQQPPPQQSAYHQPPQKPGPIRSGGDFSQSYSSLSSAKTGNTSSSPTTQSLESTESPPPLEPEAPSTKSSSEEFITPSRTPNLEQAQASPGPYHSQSHRPSNSQLFVERPQHPTYPYPPQQRAVHRPLRSASFFHEGLYFAQISYSTTPEEAMAGPELSYVKYPPFHLVQLDCMAQHKVMHKVHNLHHSVPCMTCRTMGHRGAIGTIDKSDDPAEYRFVCGWCAIRICAGCRDELRFQDNRLLDLLRVIQEREKGGGLGDPDAPSELSIEIQPEVPKIGNTQPPVHLPPEELSNLSHFGPPDFPGGSTPTSHLGTGSSEPQTCGPQGRLAEFGGYDGESCRPPSTSGERYPTPDQRAELTNIEEYPRQKTPSHPPIEPSGVNSQRGAHQRLPDPPQPNQRGPTPQPDGPLIPRRGSLESDSPEPRQELGGLEAPVGSTDGGQTHQQVQLSHRGSPPRQPSPLVQVSSSREPLPPPQPSPPEREATPLWQRGVPLVPPAESPRRKESPPISAPTISMVDVSSMLRVEGPDIAQSKVTRPGIRNPETKQIGTKQPEANRVQIEKPEVKLPEAKHQLAQVGEKQERSAESPLPSPRLQRESTPRLDKSSRSTPSPPTQVTKMGEKMEESLFMGRSIPQTVKKLPEPEVVKLAPVPIAMPKPAEPALAAKQEKPVQSPTKQEKALPVPPKLSGSMIADFTVSRPVSRPATPPERPVYPAKPELNIDLSYFNLKPVTTQERYKLPDSMQLPEIDFGGALDTMAMTGGLLGGPARAHEKPPEAPVRQEKEGSITGSMKDKKKWRLPVFGKRKEKKIVSGGLDLALRRLDEEKRTAGAG